jgi:hypothetical protein
MLRGKLATSDIKLAEAAKQYGRKIVRLAASWALYPFRLGFPSY